MTRLPDIHRVATEAMAAATSVSGWVVVRPAQRTGNMQKVHNAEDGPEHFIGALGE